MDLRSFHGLRVLHLHGKHDVSVRPDVSVVLSFLSVCEISFCDLIGFVSQLVELEVWGDQLLVVAPLIEGMPRLRCLRVDLRRASTTLRGSLDSLQRFVWAQLTHFQFWPSYETEDLTFLPETFPNLQDLSLKDATVCSFPKLLLPPRLRVFEAECCVQNLMSSSEPPSWLQMPLPSGLEVLLLWHDSCWIRRDAMGFGAWDLTGLRELAVPLPLLREVSAPNLDSLHLTIDGQPIGLVPAWARLRTLVVECRATETINVSAWLQALLAQHDTIEELRVSSAVHLHLVTIPKSVRSLALSRVELPELASYGAQLRELRVRHHSLDSLRRAMPHTLIQDWTNRA